MNDLILLINLGTTVLNERKEIVSSDFSLEIENLDDEEKINLILEKYDTRSWIVMHHLNEAFQQAAWVPWLIIVFEEEYRIAGHLASIRKNNDELKFSCYSFTGSYSYERNGVLPVSLIMLKDKKSLLRLSEITPLFNHALQKIDYMNEDLNWLFISSPPEKKWYSEIKIKDDQLYDKYGD
jgi:hypothetical protein|tara:strand:- start:81 stop:623 length:543 start_codon:yes stop_codon:yes gene_type:complete